MKKQEMPVPLFWLAAATLGLAPFAFVLTHDVEGVMSWVRAIAYFVTIMAIAMASYKYLKTRPVAKAAQRDSKLHSLAFVLVGFLFIPVFADAQLSNIVSTGQSLITVAQVVAYFTCAIAMIVAFAKYAHTREAHDAKGAGIVAACALGIGLSITIINTLIGTTGSAANMLNVPGH